MGKRGARDAPLALRAGNGAKPIKMRLAVAQHCWLRLAARSMSSATDAPVVVLEVPVPPVEPKIEAFETLIRAQEEEALRRRGLPISLARRGEKELTKQLRDLEASSKKRETTLSQEILVLRKRIADLESERATLLNTITRQNAEKAQCEDNHNSELRALRAQLYHERDEFTAQIDSLRAELEGTCVRSPDKT